MRAMSPSLYLLKPVPKSFGVERPRPTDYYSYFKLNVNFISTPIFAVGWLLYFCRWVSSNGAYLNSIGLALLRHQAVKVWNVPLRESEHEHEQSSSISLRTHVSSFIWGRGQTYPSISTTKYWIGRGLRFTNEFTTVVSRKS